MAVGMAPVCLVSEVAGFLCVSGSGQSCHKLCGKEGCLGWGPGQQGCRLGGVGKGGGCLSLWRMRKRFESQDKAFP